MNVLYGINGTGDGHISRARSLAPQLMAQEGLSLSFLFSGRAEHQYKDMTAFPNYTQRNGLVFEQNNGGIDFLATAKKALWGENSIRRVFNDAAQLDLRNVDLILTDFEPVTSLCVRLKKLPHIGIAHQYSFHSSLPAGLNPLSLNAMTRAYSPVKNTLGLHWDMFGQDILPPIFTPPKEEPVEKGMILVYLGHEELSDIKAFLAPFADKYEFHIYHNDIGHYHEDPNRSLIYKPKSAAGFKEDMARCEGLVANAGFVSSSEMLHMGRKILVKPIKGQTEQHSNARALEYLGYGRTMDSLDGGRLTQWLMEDRAAHVRFPNVAQAVAAWVAKGDVDDKAPLKQALWKQTEIHNTLK
tara:strand:+ start:116580 stop:117647 length:1068 start_codon:yes stop_codon:yes gene_type:complete